MARALGIIPARYASSRFPGKPLASLSGKPMLQHVCERAARARRLEHEGDNTQRLYHEMQRAATSNLDGAFGGVDAKVMRETADMMLRSKRVFISAVGS